MRRYNAVLLAALVAACGAPQAADDAQTAQPSQTPQAVEATDSDGHGDRKPPPVKPALMEVEPNPAEPGDMLKLTFPEETSRGLAFSLYAQRGDSWELAYDLHSDGGEAGFGEPRWYQPDESPEYPSVGILGPGPDRVPVPDVAEPGEYLVCTANAGSDFCAPLTVSTRSSQATSEPAGAGAFTSTWYGPDGEVVSENDAGFKVSASLGPDHCEWQSAVILTVIWPPGSSKTPDDYDWRQYVRDPHGVLPMGDPGDNPQPRRPLDTDATLPSDAEYGGFRTDTAELWFGPDGGDEWAYLVTPDATERWPRANPRIGCD